MPYRFRPDKPLLKASVYSLLFSIVAIPLGTVSAQTDSTGTAPTVKKKTWSINVTPLASTGDYGYNSDRQSFTSYGISVGALYRERFGLTIGYSNNNLKYRDTLQGATNNPSTGEPWKRSELHRLSVNGYQPTLKQDNYYVSARYILPQPLSKPGTLTLRLDLHAVNNDDNTEATDNVRAFSPRIGYLNAAKSRYYGLGYTRSNYGDSNNTTLEDTTLNVSQLTPTFGFAFNNYYEWVQFRLYYTRNSNSTRSLDRSTNLALEGKWTHYFPTGKSKYIPKNVQAGVLLGKRQWAVDPDTFSVYNLSDVQLGGLSLGAQWGLDKHTTFLLGAGYNQNQSLDFNGERYRYSSRYVYGGINVHW